MASDETTPSLLKRPPGAITFWLIFDHPRDQPDAFVLRPQFSAREFSGSEAFGRTIERVVSKTATSVVIVSHHAWRADTPDALRAILPHGCIRVGPMAGDDPKILEVWME